MPRHRVRDDYLATAYGYSPAFLSHECPVRTQTQTCASKFGCRSYLVSQWSGNECTAHLRDFLLYSVLPTQDRTNEWPHACKHACVLSWMGSNLIIRCFVTCA